MMQGQDVLLAELVVDIHEKPISINKAYYTHGGARKLSTEGKLFESRITAAVAQAVGMYEGNWKDVVGAVYKHGGSVALIIEMYVDDLRNEAWVVGGNMTAGGKKTKSNPVPSKPVPRAPYRKLDGSNYIKLIEDGVVKGVGMDDCCHLETTIRKIEDKVDPRIRVIYRVFE